MLPTRSELRRTTNPRYATCDRTDDGSQGVDRQTPSKAKNKSKKQQIAPKQRDGIKELGYFTPFNFFPSRVQQNLDMENLTHQPDMSVTNVESQPPGMNPTSIIFCGPWQSINGTNSSQADFEFDSEYKAPGDLYVSGPGHPRPLVKLGISDITMEGEWGVDRGEGVTVQASRPLSKPVLATPLTFIFLCYSRENMGRFIH